MLDPQATGTSLLSELIGTLSYSLDITKGQPKGHCMRCCWIGMHTGRTLGLSAHDQRGLYYTLLLKDLGCSSKAARICDLYLADDLTFKCDFERVGGSPPQTLRFMFMHTGVDAGLDKELATILSLPEPRRC